jgi:hypothetical protein
MQQQATDEFASLSAVKYDMALEMLDAQDEATRNVVGRIAKTLEEYAVNEVQASFGSVKAVTITLDDEQVQQNCVWIAVEIVKDLGFLGVRVANFSFPESICTSCGGPV